MTQPERKFFILVADDDEVDRQLIVRSAQELGALVHEAATGQEVLNLIKQYDYDCILLDYRLPDYESHELIPAIRSLEIETPSPIVVITGLGNERLAVQMMKAGACDYLPKSQITPEVLMNSIREACGDHKEQAVMVATMQDKLDLLKGITHAARERSLRYCQG